MSKKNVLILTSLPCLRQGKGQISAIGKVLCFEDEFQIYLSLVATFLQFQYVITHKYCPKAYMG